jgi:hypothetical protein
VNAEQDQFGRDMRKIIEFAASRVGEDPEIGEIMGRHFPAQLQAAQRAKEQK